MAKLLLVLLPLLFVNGEKGSIDDKAFVVTNVRRVLDLSSQIVNENLIITLERKQSTDQPVYFDLAYEPKKLAFLAYIQAIGSDGPPLPTSRLTIEDKRNVQFVRITLPNWSGKMRLTITAMYINQLKPYPTHITQEERQLVVFQDSHYLYLPYAVQRQKLEVKLFSDSLPENYSKRIKPVQRSGRTITYGPYDDIPAYSKELLRLHFESNTPFLVITKQTRLIEVSHWGNIAVEESLEVRHAGAILKGPFSRLDYMRNYKDSAPSVAKFVMTLPHRAKEIYYRDEIGNISTSTVRQRADSVQLHITPRFPLFGGWKTTFTIGYNVPTEEFLRNAGDKFCMKMKIIDHLFDNFITEDFVLKIILPETASEINFKPPYQVEEEPMQRLYTYLDTVGRPMLIVRKKNLVPSHMQDFELCYSWNRYKFIREPFMVASALFVLFLSIVVTVRLDFSFAKNAREEGQTKLNHVVERLSELQNRRNGAYECLVSAIEAFCNSKDASALAAAKKRLDQDLKSTAQQMVALQAECKTISADSTEKLASIQRHDRSAREIIQSWQHEAERFVGGKINRQVYNEKSTALQNKYNEGVEKCIQILHSL